MPGSEAVGAIIGIVGAMTGEKDDLDALEFQDEVEETNPVGKFGVKAFEKVSAADFIEGREFLNGKGDGQIRFGGRSGSGSAANGQDQEKEEEREERSSEGFERIGCHV